METPNWAEIIAAVASVAGLGLTAILAFQSARQKETAQLSWAAERLNDGMCVLHVTFRPMHHCMELQLDVFGNDPADIFLLGADGGMRCLDDGKTTIDFAMPSRRDIRIKMEERGHQSFVASAHVWAETPFVSATLTLTVREKADRRALISRKISISPIA